MIFENEIDTLIININTEFVYEYDNNDYDIKKYICCVQYIGDTTPCFGDITKSNLKCQCGEAICLNCEKNFVISTKIHFVLIVT